MEQKVKTARAIIRVPNSNSIFIIKREKQEKGIYYTLPGGHVEENETYEQAVTREIYEEIGIKINIKREFTKLYNKDLDREEVFYVCEYVEGIIGSGKGEEFVNLDFEKYGSFELVELNLNQVQNYNILPLEIKEMLIKEANFL